jgi:hypothetical protein
MKIRWIGATLATTGFAPHHSVWRVQTADLHASLGQCGDPRATFGTMGFLVEKAFAARNMDS